MRGASESQMGNTFTAVQHALLFAWLSEAVLARVGREAGETLMRRAVRRYGEERGRRMALRAEADGEPLSMANFMAYGELPATPEAFESTSEAGEGTIRKTIVTCPWHSAWAEHDLMMHGRLYCLEIDQALVRGFNPALRLDVNCTQPNDGVPCEFVFHDVSEPGLERGRVMPWAYHLGHLYWTMGGVIVKALGAAGETARGEALARFGERYGEEAARVVSAYWGIDFRRLLDDHEGNKEH
ncbi:MAG: L-2-amino-thiazoline-4-carboxylic acid hydrolase [Anaerolineae bacterium]